MLRVEKLSFEITGRKLLKDVSFQVRKGEVLALLGANGAGKSTLMHLLCGDRKPTSGMIHLLGKDIQKYPLRDLAKCRAMLNQQQHISLSFPVKDIVMMGRYVHFKSTPSKHDFDVVTEVMEVCGITSFADRVFLGLSGGEQQRVQLARVLAQIWDNPDSLLLLDEPISALDIYYQQKILAIAKALSRKGFMVLIVLHDVNFAATYADKILMLKNGRKLFYGTPIEVLNKKDLYTIFSVDTSIHIDKSTLKPSVSVLEMEFTLFNSTLTEKNDMTVDIRDRVAAAVMKERTIQARDLAMKLHISLAEANIYDPRNTVYYFNKGHKTLMNVLATFETSRCSIINRVCQHSKLFSIPSINLIDCLQDDASWACCILLERDNATLICAFDEFGDELFSVALLEEEDKSLFKAEFQKYFSTESVQNIDFRKRLPELKNEHSNLVISRNIQQSNFDAIKTIFIKLCREKLVLNIAASNKGWTQSYEGVIENLIDQGNRYIIKAIGFELLIYLDQIGEVMFAHEIQQMDKNSILTIYDLCGDIVLAISYGSSLIFPPSKQKVHIEHS